MTGFPRVESVKRRVRHSRGFTLLEMMVATTIMAIAVVGLMSGLASATRNAARLQDYDRAVQLARVRMNELLLDRSLPRTSSDRGPVRPGRGRRAGSGLAGAADAHFEMPPVARANDTSRSTASSWKSGGPAAAQRRTFTLDAFRPRVLTAEDIAALPVGAPMT